MASDTIDNSDLAFDFDNDFISGSDSDETFTRDEGSRGMIAFKNMIRPRPTREWGKMADQLCGLHEKVLEHEAMVPNRHRPYDTPPSPKDRIFFIWEYSYDTLAGRPFHAYHFLRIFDSIET